MTSAFQAKQIQRRVKKEKTPKGYTVDGKNYSFKDLLALVQGANPSVSESTLRSRLKIGRRRWETLIAGVKK